MRQFPEPNSNSALGEAAQLQELIDSMKEDFGTEMRSFLTICAAKRLMRLQKTPRCKKRYRIFLDLVIRIVGKERAQVTLTQIMGTLFLHYFSGGTWEANI